MTIDVLRLSPSTAPAPGGCCSEPSRFGLFSGGASSNFFDCVAALAETTRCCRGAGVPECPLIDALFHGRRPDKGGCQ